MITEVALITVKEGSESDFIAGYKAGVPLIQVTDGYISHTMQQGIESPNRFVLTIQWESVEAHNVNFRESERFQEWRSHIGPFMAEPPNVEHFVTVGSHG